MSLCIVCFICVNEPCRILLVKGKIVPKISIRFIRILIPYSVHSKDVRFVVLVFLAKKFLIKMMFGEH